MATRMENLSAMFSNVKIRTVIIMTVIVLFMVMIIGFLSFRRNNAAIESSAQLTKASNLESVPGLNPTSPQYAQVQQQVNEQNYLRAQQTQGTAIPTVIHASSLNQEGISPDVYTVAPPSSQNSDDNDNNPNFNSGSSSANAGDASNASSAQNVKVNQAQLKAIQEQQKAELEAAQKKLDALSSQEAQQALQQTQQSMQREAQQLMAAWATTTATPAQQFVIGTYKEVTTTTPTTLENGNGVGRAGSMNTTNTAPPIIKAGTIYYGILETAVNSDEPGPIMVKITTGTYKNARLIGAIQSAPEMPGTNGPDKLILNFNTMSIATQPSSVSISAVAIDPDTARTALASDVNYHYIQRYGSLFASAFLEGYGQAVSQAGSVTTTNLFGTTNTQYGNLSGVEEVLAGFGQVGQSWGQQIADKFDRKPTVVVNAGVSIGVLFLSDVTVSNVVPPAGTPEPMTTWQSRERIPTAVNVNVGDTSSSAMGLTNGGYSSPESTYRPALIPVPVQ